MKVQCENCDGIFEIKDYDFDLHYQGQCLETPEETKHKLKCGFANVIIILFIVPICLLTTGHYVQIGELDPFTALLIIMGIFAGMMATLYFFGDFYIRKVKNE